MTDSVYRRSLRLPRGGGIVALAPGAGEVQASSHLVDAVELAEGRVCLDASQARANTRARLLELPGIGPWTADYIAMRVLGDRDVFLATDLGVRRALRRLGLDDDPAAAAALAQRWRPYRAYAMLALWALN